MLAAVSCSTAYLVRDADGIWRTHWRKRGILRIEEQRELDGLLGEIRERGVPLDRMLMGGTWLRGWLCQGVLIDMIERKLRFYVCGARILQPAVGWIESIERALARASVWRGWELGYAWGRRDDFAALVPEAAALIEPERFEAEPLAELSSALAEHDELASWDRASLRLHYRYYCWTSWDGLLSVIDEQLEVLNFGFAWRDGLAVLPWLTHGAALLDALGSEIPHPLPYESELAEGVVIDLPARCIRHWAEAPTPPRLLEKIATLWPSWRIERLRYGHAGHLAAIACRDSSLLIPEAELSKRSRWGHHEFDLDWLRERRELKLDPRELRGIEEVWGD